MILFKSSIENLHSEIIKAVPTGLASGWRRLLDSSGRAQRHPRFGKEAEFGYLARPAKSGVALRLPPQSKIFRVPVQRFQLRKNRPVEAAQKIGGECVGE